MKSIKSILITLSLLTLAIFIPLNTYSIAKAQTGNVVIILDVTEHGDNEIVVKADVKENSGVIDMLLTLDYSDNAFELTKISYGSALASLNPIHTGYNDGEGLKTRPFRINYSGEQNDYTTGELVTLTFIIKDNVPDGDYEISFNYTRDSDVAWLDNGKIKYKNPLIDRAKFTFSGNAITRIESVTNGQPVVEQSKGYIIPAIIGSIVGVGAIVAVTIIVLKKKKSKKRWTKL